MYASGTPVVVQILSINARMTLFLTHAERIAGYAKAMGVIDRNVSTGTLGGITFTEIRHSLYDVDEKPATLNFHAGMRGKEVRVEDLKRMAEKTLKAANGEKVLPLVEWA